LVLNDEFNELCRLHAVGDPKGGFFGRVTITLEDGSKLNSTIQDAGLSFGGAGWRRDEMGDKFRWLTNELIDPHQVDDLVELAWRIDELDNVKELIQLIR